MAKKKNTGQCLSTESKVAYKNSGNSGKNWKIETKPDIRETCFLLFYFVRTEFTAPLAKSTNPGYRILLSLQAA